VRARTGRRFARSALAPFEGRLLHCTAEGDFVMAPSPELWNVRATMNGLVHPSCATAVGVVGPGWALDVSAGYGPGACGGATATSLPFSPVTRVCQTELRRPM